MRASANLVHAVVRAEFETHARASHLDAFRFNGYCQAGRGGGFVRDIYVGTEAPLASFEMRREQLNAGPLHESHHEAGGEHLRHGSKLGRFGIELRHGFAVRHAIGEAMPETWLQRRLQSALSLTRCLPPYAAHRLHCGHHIHGSRANVGQQKFDSPGAGRYRGAPQPLCAFLGEQGPEVSGDRALRGHHHDVRRRALRKVALALQGGGPDEFRYVVNRIRLAKASKHRPLGHAAEARHG